MKKIMILSFGLLMGASAVMARPVVLKNDKSTVVISQEKREKIKAEDLPEAVKTTLQGDDYKGWMINAAYHYTDKDTYEVELKNGAETKTVMFDKDGKKVDK